MAVRLRMTGQVAEPCPFGPRLDGTKLEGSVPLVCILCNGPCHILTSHVLRLHIFPPSLALHIMIFHGLLAEHP